jgi:hypothetical protein
MAARQQQGSGGTTARTAHRREPRTAPHVQRFFS